MNKIKLPDIYGQGAIFAYSGLEGDNRIYESLVGTLLGDCVGLALRCKTRAFLYTDFENVKNIYYGAVTSDMIFADVKCGDGILRPLYILAVRQNVFIIDCPENVKVFFNIRNDYEKSDVKDVSVYRTESDVFGFAVKRSGERFRYVLSYGESAAEDVSFGFDADCEKIIADRTRFYENLPKPAFRDEYEEKLYYKCFSIMRSMIFTKQGKAPFRWSTPDRFPHNGMWLWDTAYHTVGLKHISPALAKETVISFLSCICDDGFLPHMVTPRWQSSITQPPTLAWASLEIHKYSPDKEFLEKVYAPLSAYIEWDIKNRDKNGNGLPEWLVGDDPYCRCDESGMDNTPRFDEATEMDCIDFAAFLANDIRCLSEIAAILGKTEDEAKWKARFETIKEKINDILWDDEDEFYYDRKLSDGKFHKVKSVASFITLFAGICDEKRAAAMLRHLKDPNEFGTPFPVPTVSADYKTYKSKDMFHGTVWLNFNFLIADGLERYGYKDEARELRNKTVNTVKYWYASTGVIYEFYDSTAEQCSNMLARKDITPQPFLPEIKAQAIRDFSWGAVFIADTLINGSLSDNNSIQ